MKALFLLADLACSKPLGVQLQDAASLVIFSCCRVLKKVFSDPTRPRRTHPARVAVVALLATGLASI